MKNLHYNHMVEELINNPDGLKVKAIARSIYNSEVTLFDIDAAKKFKIIHNSVQRFLWMQSRKKQSPFERKKWGLYALKKGFKLWYTIVFYNILIYAALLTFSAGLGWNTFSLPTKGWSWGEAFTPIYSSSYWFMTMYMGILLLSPFLSRMAQALTKKEYQILLLVLLIMNFGQEQLGYGKVYSSNILLYILVFLIGGYVSLHKPQGRWLKYTWGGYFVVCLLLAAASVAKQLFLHPTSCPQIHGLAYNSIPLFTSICFFLWVANMNNVKSKISDFAIKTGPYILAVYLIHENKLIRPLLWDKLIRPTDHIGDWYLVPYMFAVSLAILLLCIAIDYLRTLCFAKIGSVVRKTQLLSKPETR